MHMLKLVRNPLSVVIALSVALVCVGLISASYALLQSPTPTNTIDEDLASIFADGRFPVSVDPEAKLITENPYIDWYVDRYLSIDTSQYRHRRMADKFRATFAKFSFIQQLASPLTRTLVIYPGERHEEVAKNFADILRWDSGERATFLTQVTNTVPILSEGKFFPGRYVVTRDASPEQVAEQITSTFQTEVLDRYDSTVAARVPLAVALTIASLLEREAYDFTDMRVISGIIWNRLFIDMPLQLDATLQYARGSLLSESRWWPRVRPADKFIDSPFNTYQVSGLPPTPIANPSVEAIVAALNPRQTDCYFYFHDDDGTFYCTPTYEEHVAALTTVFGQGR